MHQNYLKKTITGLFFVLFIALSISCYTRMVKRDLDFKVFHGAAVKVLNNDLGLYEFGKDPIFTYKYSPSFALMMTPFGYFEEVTARKVWSVLNILSFILAWIAFVAYLKKWLPELPRSYGVQLLTLVMVLQPIVNNSMQGNINAILLSLMAGSLFFMGRRSFLSGLLAAVAVSIKLTPGVVFFVFLSRRNYREMFWFSFLVFMMMVVIPLGYFGKQETLNLYSEWYGILRDTDHFPFFKWTNQSALVVLSRIMPLDIAGKIHLGINVVLGCIIARFVWKKEELKTLLFSFIFILSFSPIAWLEYYMFLLPVYFVINYLLLCGKLDKISTGIWLVRFVSVHILLKFVVGRDLSRLFAFYGQHFWGLLVLIGILLVNLDKLEEN